jgi:ketosteroid isomerase-like protein
MEVGAMKWIVSVFGFALHLASAPVAAQTSCDKSALMEADKGFAKAAAEKNLDGLMAFYHENASLLAPESPPVEGKESLRTLFQEIFADPEGSLTWSATKASVSKSCDLGYTRGVYTQWLNEEGNYVEDRGKYLVVWIHSEDGKWLVIEDMFNSGL